MVRDPAAMLLPLLKRLESRDPVWVFGYASLLWRQEFEAAQHVPAKVHGWHRALRMRSRVNRGSPDKPGLVFALLPGGCCQGMVFRLHARTAEADLRRLWAREMPTGVYDPRWLPCRTAQGTVPALGFTLSRHSPNHTGRLTDEHLSDILRHARGRYGSTLDYLLETAQELRRRSIVDKEVERLVELARQIGLHPPA